MVLYADVLFAINFSMDFLALFLTKRILHKKIYKIRILISALIGAIYSIIEMVITIYNPILHIGISLFISLLMCIISFGEKSVGRFLVFYGMFWGVSALMGGVMSIIFSLFNKLFYSYIINLDMVNSNAYNGTRFIVIVLISVMVSILLSKLYTSKKDIKSVEVLILIDTYVYKLSGLCDSGHLLTEPFTGRGIILVSSFSKIGKEVEIQPEYKKRYIPYSGVGANGILKGIIPTKIIINENEVDAIIATVNKTNFGGYDALIPSSLL